MKTNRTIKRMLFITGWVVLAGGMLTLLIAAMSSQGKDVCKDYRIVIAAGDGDDLFLDERAIYEMLKNATGGTVKGQPKSAFNLQQMEELLESNMWVKDAQLYFDNNNVLQVTISERQPVARIFTASGRSFYIDETTQMLQLSDRISARLPVFTGFPDGKLLKGTDSALLRQISNTAQFISKDPFWSSQVSQIDLVSCGPNCWEMDMIPVIGNHIVKLGTGAGVEDKFSRLFSFYKQVLARSGFDKYKTVDVRFAGQVVGSRSENPKVDAAMLKKSVDALLEQIKQAEAMAAQDRPMAPAANPVALAGTDAPAATEASPADAAPPAAPTTNQIRNEPEAARRTETRPAPKRTEPAPKVRTNNSQRTPPKAVMQRRER